MNYYLLQKCICSVLIAFYIASICPLSWALAPHSQLHGQRLSTPSKGLHISSLNLIAKDLPAIDHNELNHLLNKDIKRQKKLNATFALMSLSIVLMFVSHSLLLLHLLIPLEALVFSILGLSIPLLMLAIGPHDTSLHWSKIVLVSLLIGAVSLGVLGFVGIKIAVGGLPLVFVLSSLASTLKVFLAFRRLQDLPLGALSIRQWNNTLKTPNNSLNNNQQLYARYEKRLLKNLQSIQAINAQGEVLKKPSTDPQSLNWLSKHIQKLFQLQGGYALKSSSALHSWLASMPADEFQKFVDHYQKKARDPRKGALQAGILIEYYLEQNPANPQLQKTQQQIEGKLENPYFSAEGTLSKLLAEVTQKPQSSLLRTLGISLRLGFLAGVGLSLGLAGIAAIVSPTGLLVGIGLSVASLSLWLLSLSFQRKDLSVKKTLLSQAGLFLSTLTLLFGPVSWLIGSLPLLTGPIPLAVIFALPAAIILAGLSLDYIGNELLRTNTSRTVSKMLNRAHILHESGHIHPDFAFADKDLPMLAKLLSQYLVERKLQAFKRDAQGQVVRGHPLFVLLAAVSPEQMPLLSANLKISGISPFGEELIQKTHKLGQAERASLGPSLNPQEHILGNQLFELANPAPSTKLHTFFSLLNLSNLTLIGLAVLTSLHLVTGFILELVLVGVFLGWAIIFVAKPQLLWQKSIDARLLKKLKQESLLDGSGKLAQDYQIQSELDIQILEKFLKKTIHKPQGSYRGSSQVLASLETASFSKLLDKDLSLWQKQKVWQLYQQARSERKESFALPLSTLQKHKLSLPQNNRLQVSA